MNLQTLQPVRSKADAEHRGRNGGKASGESRRRKRELKKYARAILEMPVSWPEIEQKMTLAGIPVEWRTNEMAVVLTLLNKALDGDVSAARLLLELVGESPRGEIYRENLQLKREHLEYQKDKDAGIMGEMEDMDEIEDLIYEAHVTECMP